MKSLLFIGVCLGVAYAYHYYPFKLEHIGHTEKIWVWRVNNLEKQAYTQKLYTGLEVDVMFDITTKTFDVRHPNNSSIGLSLDEYMRHLGSDKGLWIDFKNLNKKNRIDALKRLIEITDKHKISKNNLRIESLKPKNLMPFQEVGFKTSYYLPTNLHKLSKDELLIEINEIRKTMEIYETTTISTDIVNYEITAKYFPEKKKMIWTLFTTFHNNFISNYFKTKSVVQDTTVEVFLIPIARKFNLNKR
ncbi:MAG: hypothetical protein ACTH3E_09920 [Psychroflexus halocasei]|uniref:hypothetical protein n=1 Tax=Psychroflexus sp. S27 TaxID=1982757 RepID=UPI0018651D3A|nr:hypothetical protein [Psychroflexus sp. S27]